MTPTFTVIGPMVVILSVVPTTTVTQVGAIIIMVMTLSYSLIFLLYDFSSFTHKLVVAKLIDEVLI